jgi:YidC/Oxa1 family membrane protein insertase
VETIFQIIGAPLGALMNVCYAWTASYGWAVLLFTLLTKVILMPLSLLAQKNSIKMVRMQPELADIKAFNSGNGEQIMAETKALYKQEHYSTFISILPLLIQIPIILGLIDVIYQPLTHLLQFDRATIAVLTTQTAQLLHFSVPDLGYGAQLQVIEMVHLDPAAYSAAGIDVNTLVAITNLDTRFLGLDLSAIPSFGSVELAIPVLSGLSALVLSLVQNRYNVLQAEAGFLSKWGMTVFLVAFSTYFAYILPCGLGLYWTAGNLLSIPVLALCNLVYNPRKFIDYENRLAKASKNSFEKQDKALVAKLKAREKADIARFAKTANKELVIYSESSGFYKYFQGYIDWLREHSDIVVHYVTSDPADPIFALAERESSQLAAYYVGPKALIGFMMKLNADIVLMTLPDLENYHIKRSLVRKDIEYIYTDHGFGSFTLMLRENALDHFDTIMCYGPNHIAEIKAQEALYGLPQKALVKTGFDLYDRLALGATQVKREHRQTDSLQILIAPSWQRHNIMDICLDNLLATLSNKGFRIIVRPHPEYVKRFAERLADKIAKHPASKYPDVTFETDFSSNASVYTSDLVITDWSTIAQEFSLTTKRPTIFINTPMKVINSNWQAVGLVPLEIAMRSELGVSVDLEQIPTLDAVVTNLIAHANEHYEHLNTVLHERLFDVGKGAEGGASYIASRTNYARSLRACELSAKVSL